MVAWTVDKSVLTQVYMTVKSKALPLVQNSADARGCMLENLMVFQMVAYLVGMTGKHWVGKMEF